MNLKQKTWMAGGLGTLAAAVWVPQFLARGGDEVPALPELSAEQPADGVRTAPPVPAAPLDDTATPPAPASGALAPESGEGGSRLAGLEASLAQLTRQDSAQDLSALFARLDPRPAATEEPTTTSKEDSALRGLGASAWLEEFVTQNPLTGMILGPNDAVALLGHRVVRAGDTLQGGRIRVVSIGAAGIELTTEGVSRSVELPAFRARSSTPVVPDSPVSPPLAPAAAPPTEEQGN